MADNWQFVIGTPNPQEVSSGSFWLCCDVAEGLRKIQVWAGDTRVKERYRISVANETKQNGFRAAA